MLLTYKYAQVNPFHAVLEVLHFARISVTFQQQKLYVTVEIKRVNRSCFFLN